MKLVMALLVIAALVVGLLYMQGTFNPEKVGPGTAVREARRAGDLPTVPVSLVRVEVLSEAVGTVRARRSARVSPRIMGTILEITVSQGDEVAEGALLVRLDDREVRARLAAAKADLSQADAKLSQAEAAYRRGVRLSSKDQ